MLEKVKVREESGEDSVNEISGTKSGGSEVLGRRVEDGWTKVVRKSKKAHS